MSGDRPDQVKRIVSFWADLFIGSTKEQKKRVEEFGEAVDEKREDMKRRRRRLNAIDTEGETVKDGDDT